MLLLAPRFSKYLHGAAGLFPNVVEKMPYWYLCNTDGTTSPATWEELADDADKFYEEVCLLAYPTSISTSYQPTHPFRPLHYLHLLVGSVSTAAPCALCAAESARQDLGNVVSLSIDVSQGA